MASKNRSSGTAAFRYASSLVDLAMENGAIPAIEQDMADLSAMIAGSSDLQFLIRSPLVKAGVQQDALASIADKAKFHPLTKNFLLTLAHNRRLKDIDAILKAVSSTLSARRGELTAKVQTATDMTADQKQALTDNLGKTFNRPVALDTSVNKDLIGGVVVTLGSIMIDDSIKSKLERMGRAMKHSGTKAA